MNFSKDYISFGTKIIENFRDKNYKSYKQLLEYSQSMTLEEYDNIHKNPNIDKKIQENVDNSFKFLNSLNKFQTEQLNKLVLKTLDDTAFFFLREIEEGLIINESIGLTYKGKEISNIYNEFLSGTFFGEYFLWAENYSLYGKVLD